MTDTIINETEIITNSYTSRKGQTYEELNTKPEDWKACDIIDYKIDNKGREIPIFDLLKDYRLVTTRFTSLGGCNLCGHYIEIVCYIKNDKEKYLMIVGTECVSNCYGKIIKKKIKEFKDNETRIKVKDFLIKYIEHCNTQYAYPYPKTLYEKNMIRTDAYLGRFHAQKILNNYDKTGVRKLSNFMKLHEKELELKPVIQTLDKLGAAKLKDLVDAYISNSNIIISFGQHKDKKVFDIPLIYIKWAIETVKQEESNYNHFDEVKKLDNIWNKINKEINNGR